VGSSNLAQVSRYCALTVTNGRTILLQAQNVTGAEGWVIATNSTLYFQSLVFSMAPWSWTNSL
jgi:hypothetical protein